MSALLPIRPDPFGFVWLSLLCMPQLTQTYTRDQRTAPPSNQHVTLSHTRKDTKFPGEFVSVVGSTLSLPASAPQSLSDRHMHVTVACVSSHFVLQNVPSRVSSRSYHSSPQKEIGGRSNHNRQETNLDDIETPTSPFGNDFMLFHQHERQGSQTAAQPNVAQKPIMSMEDDEDYDSDDQFEERHVIFKDFGVLLEPENVSSLAVFVNYILCNSDAAPILFFLITGLYEEGNLKEMRKWAYEIHSTFLIPNAVSIWPQTVSSKRISNGFPVPCYSRYTSRRWTSRS